VVNGTDNLTKQISIHYPGTYRFSYNIRRTGGAATSLAQICRNRGGTRTAIGRIGTSSSTGASTYFEDIPGWEDGDIAELHATESGGSGSNTSADNFRVYGHIAEVPAAAPAGIVLKATI
jgi:hypothetical protein